MLRLRQLILLTGFLVVLQVPLKGQQVVCGSVDPYSLEHTDPTAYAQWQAAEEWIRNYIDNNPELLRNARTSAGGKVRKTRFVIPTVVHVIYDNNSVTPDSISLAQAMSAFWPLFEDFRYVPGSPGYSPSGVDYGVEFSLATIDPDGNPTTGIVYHNKPEYATWPRDNETEPKSTLTWPKTKYFNIWLTTSIPGGPGSPQGIILGYAQFPTFGSPLTDGVVIRYDCWGVEGSLRAEGRFNRTATHELGHWLNLFHTFQSGCGNNNCRNSGDQVCDTPPSATEGGNFGGGYERLNTCRNDNPDRPENPRNYMDYLSDFAKNHFTKGQLERTIPILQRASLPQRYQLWQENNLKSTGTGPYGRTKAHFVSDIKRVCPGGKVVFTDFSMGLPDQFTWQFEGGTPATATTDQVEVTYAQPGTYSVRLIVKNQAPDSINTDTLFIENYITVVDDVRELPFSENFDALTNQASFPPQGWWIDNPDGFVFANGAPNRVDVTWSLNIAAKAAQIQLGTYSDYGQRDGLVLPALNLAKPGETHAALTFDRQYVPFKMEQDNRNFELMFYDTLSVKASTDCGSSWKTIFRLGGDNLKTVINESGDTLDFVTQITPIPDPGSYRPTAINLDEFVGTPNLLVKFETINGFGNHVFVDNISVTYDEVPKVVQIDTIQNATSIGKPVVRPQDLRVWPNPFNQSLKVVLPDAQPGEWVTFTLQDGLGRIVATTRVQVSTSNHTLEFTPGSTLPQGVYVLRASTRQGIYQQKVVRGF